MKRTAIILTAILMTGLTAAQPLDNATNNTTLENDTVLNNTGTDNETTTDSENITIDTVIITSSESHADNYISGPASERIGAPILQTDMDQLRSSTSTALENFEVEKAIIVGGPAVISEEVEEEINSQVNITTRLWDITQIGTSVEVSKYFWSSSDEATIVQYSQQREEDIFNQIDNTDENPILLSKEGTLSATVLAEIQRLGVEEVTVYSTGAENVTEDLEGIGVDDIEIEIIGIDSETNETENNQTGLNETEENRTDPENETELGSGELTPEKAAEWMEIQKDGRLEWREQLSESPETEEIAERIIQRAENSTNENTSSEAQQLLEEARTDYEAENYFEARNKAFRANSIIRAEQFRTFSPEEVEQQIHQEREDIREAIQSLNKSQQKQMEQLREAESIDEMLEIVRQHRQRIGEINKPLPGNQTGNNTINETETEIEGFTQEPGDEEQLGESQLDIQVDGNLVTATAEYTAEEAGYKPRFNIDEDGNEITFNLELERSENASAQVITRYALENATNLDGGNYTAVVNLIVDGEEENSITREIKVPGNTDTEDGEGNEIGEPNNSTPAI